MDYECLKKKHAEKVKQYNDLKNSYESSKKENAYNRKQSVSIVQEKQQQINDLVKQVNSLKGTVKVGGNIPLKYCISGV